MRSAAAFYRTLLVALFAAPHFPTIVLDVSTGGFDDEEQKRGTWKVYDEAGELLKTQSFK
jgi:hypothetical protein